MTAWCGLALAAAWLGGCHNPDLLVCSVCDTPPAPVCVSSDLLRTYDSLGACVNDGCAYQFTDARCGHGCDAATGACVPCQDECAQGAAECSAGSSRRCEVGAEGCLTWSPSTPCADGFCADPASCGVCQDECLGVGFTECVAGNVRSCEADANRCLRWSAFDVCATGTCASATRCEGCLDACPSEGTTECASGALRTCQRSAQGCLAWTAFGACPAGVCADASTCGGCVDACPARGALQCAAGALQRCDPLPSGCLGWQATSATGIAVLADTYVRGAQYADIAYGNDVPISVKNTTWSQEFMRKAYFAFDVGALSGTNYTAKLRLEQNQSMQAGDLLLVYGITDNRDWNPATLAEGAITYNNAPHNDTASEYFTAEGTSNGAAVRQLGSFNSVSVGVKEVDVTSFVHWAKGANASYGAAAKDADGILTVMLRGNIFTNQGFTNIASKESTSSTKPQIAITCQP